MINFEQKPYNNNMYLTVSVYKRRRYCFYHFIKLLLPCHNRLCVDNILYDILSRVYVYIIIVYYTVRFVEYNNTIILLSRSAAAADHCYFYYVRIAAEKAFFPPFSLLPILLLLLYNV